ncbi:hypothetical protein [Sporosarcina limicola]|uniref:Uncharacterized protein n=1 Tax=Sporosarcina limicola TaxID=34101 RepID=A0A927MG54_9BACL|nr:hypothetical protein [Sporosarcina limicola]MBE1553258.1 hypothetical protein [Sporosarcina limicola]
MQQWNGLLRKEWVTMKRLLLVSALFAVATMSILPIIITRFLGAGVHVFEIALVICFMWASASVLAPVIALFTMLERDMKRPDMWLHSNASIFKLIGSKVVFAMLIGTGGLFIPTIVLALYYAFLTPSILTFNALLFYGSIFVVVLFVASISILCTGFFFWVLYQLMRPYIKGFSIPVTIILFFFSSYVVQITGNSDLYNKIVKVGPVDLLQLKNPKLDIEKGYFELTGATFYTGQIVFDVLFTVIMFIVATVLFEKKVRL